MTRKRIDHALIPNGSARKACFKKRKAGLMKKMSEFTTLCDVRAFLIILSPVERGPILWPSHPGALEELRRYFDLPEIERLKKKLNQEEYLRLRIDKLREQSKKQQKINNTLELDYLMHRIYQCHGIHGLDLFETQTAMTLVIEKLKAIKGRIEHLRATPPLTLDCLPFQNTNMLSMSQTGGNFSVERQLMIDLMNNQNNIIGSSNAMNVTTMPWTSSAITDIGGVHVENLGSFDIFNSDQGRSNGYNGMEGKIPSDHKQPHGNVYNELTCYIEGYNSIEQMLPHEIACDVATEMVQPLNDSADANNHYRLLSNFSGDIITGNDDENKHGISRSGNQTLQFPHPWIDDMLT